jgi:hypothetical protein
VSRKVLACYWSLLIGPGTQFLKLVRVQAGIGRVITKLQPERFNTTHTQIMLNKKNSAHFFCSFFIGIIISEQTIMSKKLCTGIFNGQLALFIFKFDAFGVHALGCGGN